MGNRLLQANDKHKVIFYQINNILGEVLNGLGIAHNKLGN